MGRNLGAFRRELANLAEDPDSNKTAMSYLRSIVKDLDEKVIQVFVLQVSETKEIGSESGGFTVSLFEDLARAHGVKIAPHVEMIMPVIIRTLSVSEGSLSVQQACSKAVAAMARYGIDPATPGDKKRNVIHSLCKPLSDSLLDSQHHQHLALGSARCLKSLVDCDNWRYAAGEMVNNVCQSLAVALEATSSEAKSHMALVIALVKHNPFTIEAYARLFVKSGLRILDLGVVERDSQKRLLAIQMLNFLMKYLNPKSICSEVELILQEMEKHQQDQEYCVKFAAYETMRTAERLIGEEDPVFDAESCKSRISLSGSIKSTPTPRGDDHWSVGSRHERSYVNDQEDHDDVVFPGAASGRTGVSGSPLVRLNEETGSVLESPRTGNEFQFSGVGDATIESDWSHQRNRNASKDPFSKVVQNRQQRESSSSSSISDASGTISPTNTTEDKKAKFYKPVCSRTNRSRRKTQKRQDHRHGFAQVVQNRQQRESSSSSAISDTSGTISPHRHGFAHDPFTELSSSSAISDTSGTIRPHRHGFAQDPFTELVESRQQRQYESESGTSPTNTTTEDIDMYEDAKSDLDSETETGLKTGEAQACVEMGIEFLVYCSCRVCFCHVGTSVR
ncbi:unnamed protein product [Microthlaspi erraticum]|uniref:TORTIFOLIA1/SINE1-2 N-terminal domain-containing protein n=1 Tax=Microthlaspi erraticum TaxID=1685480 RepID=A0A6D2L0T5_9BRAS|nr:unnamed protein product [Microthlaspi erraticum]